MSDVDKGLQQLSDTDTCPGTSQTVYLGKALDNLDIAPPLDYSQRYPPSLRSRSLLPLPPVLPATPYYPVPTYHLQPSQQQIYHLHFHHLLQPPPVSPFRDENLADLRDRNRFIHYQNPDIIAPVALDRRPSATPLERYARDSDRHLIDPPPAYYRSTFVPSQDSQRTLVDIPHHQVLPPVLKTATEFDQQRPSNDSNSRAPSSAETKQRALEEEPLIAEERSASTEESSQPAERENHPSSSNIQKDRAACSLPPNIGHANQFLSPDRLRGQAGLPKTTKIPAKGSSRMYQHLSAHASGSAMLGSSPSAFASSPLTDLPDMDWAIRPEAEHSNVPNSDSQRTVTGDAKAAAMGVVVLQSLPGQRDLPLSTDDDKEIHDEQGHQQEQQHHQGDPFTASSSFTYTSAHSPKSLSPMINQAHSQSSEHIVKATPPSIDRLLSSESSSSDHSYTSSTQEEEEQFQSEIQNLLNSVAWHPENESPQGLKTNRTGVDFQETHRQQFAAALDKGINKSEDSEDSPLMSAAGTPQSHTRSHLAVEASPGRPASTTPTVQSTGAASNHSQSQQHNGHNQAHLVPVTQVGDRYVYDPSRASFPANGTMSAGHAQSNSGGSNPVSINQESGRTVSYDMMGGPKSAMPAFTYQYTNTEEGNGNGSASNANDGRHPLSAAPALGGGVTFLQLPGGGQQFYSYNGNGSPGVVIPTNILQPARAYSNSGQGASPFSANQQYVSAGSAYHHGPSSVTVPGFPPTMMYHSRSAGPEPTSAFQMVISGSHDFFDQGNAGKARKPGLYQVKNEPMSDGIGEEDDGENDDTVGDYEQDRLRNIRRNQEMMERLGLAGNSTGYADNRGASRSPSKTIKRKTSSMGLKGTLDHKHRFKSRVPSNMGPVRASNRIASKQHRSVSYADDDRRGGVSESEDDYSDAMEEDEDDWDEDDYRRAPRSRRRNVRRKPSYQQSGRSRATSGGQSRGYRPTLREMLDTHPRIREAFPLFYHILTDDLMINNESFPLIGSIPSTCTPVEKANFLKEFYHKGRRCLAQLDAFTARCDKRYDGPGDKWKPLDHDTKIAIRDIRRKGVERCENYKYTRRDILNKALGKNNWEAIEDGMILWDVNSENCDPANDLAGAELPSPVASVHESTNRRHVSSRQRNGHNGYGRDGQGLPYSESSVAQQVPYTARSMQQYGVYANDRSAGYSATPQLRTAGYNDNFSQAQMQTRNTWQQGNHNGFHVPSLPYAAVSSGGQQMVYTPSEAVHLAQQQHYNAVVSSGHPNGEHNQQYANFNMDGNAAVMQQQQQQEQQQQQSQHNQQGSHQNGSTQNGSLSAASAHEINEQSMGMMHGGIDMDFHMAEPSYKSEVSL